MVSPRRTRRRWLRQDGEPRAPRKAIHGEVMVERQDVGHAGALRGTHERGISEVHRQVGVLVHELGQARYIARNEIDQAQDSVAHHIEQRDRALRHLSEQVHRLCQRGPDGDQRWSVVGSRSGGRNPLEGLDTPQVAGVASVE